jgi:hypothetical protein
VASKFFQLWVENEIFFMVVGATLRSENMEPSVEPFLIDFCFQLFAIDFFLQDTITQEGSRRSLAEI